MDLNGVSNQSAPPGIADAIRDAANATGADFQYLLATARAESGLNPQASATTSSARGLYQFVDQTWLAAMKRSGASLGYGPYADAIVQTAAGRYEVSDPAMRRAILALRDDPSANAALAGALTKDNAVQLAGRLGRAPSEGELYVAHVLGAAGAARLTMLLAASPGAPADLSFPAAAEANHAIFYDRQGHARSVSDVYSILTARYAGNRAPGAVSSASAPANGAGMFLAAPFGPPGTGGDTAMAAAMAGTPAAAAAVDTAPAAAPPAPSAPLFAGLFGDRRGPASQLVVNAYTAHAPTPPAAPPTPASGASLVAASGSRQMFQAPDGIGLFGR